MIKAIIRKEIRENLKVAVPGLIGFSLLVWYVAHGYDLMMKNVVMGLGQLENARTQPLLSSTFLMQTAWLCGIFGAALGFLQIFSERNRDLSAFLTHRPMSRAKIFLGKITAGLLLYLLAMGLPLAAFIIWDASPGHVAAPFEAGMALPAVNPALAGVAFYFAGILVAQRQARWYASRLLAVGLAILAALAAAAGSADGNVNVDPPMPAWGWPLIILFFAAVLGFAAWGSFREQGLYRGQPVIARLALIVTVFVGSVMLIGVGGSIVANALWPSSYSYSYSSYVMTTNGVVYRQEVHNGPNEYVTDQNGNYVFAGQRQEYYDLQGKIVMSKTNNAPMTSVEFFRDRADTAGIEAVFDKKSTRQRYMDNRFYDLARHPIGRGNSLVWYFWYKTGRFVAYSAGDRRAAMSLGPEGFARDANGNGERFAVFSPVGDNLWQMPHTATKAFSVNLDLQTIDILFTTTADEPIGGIGGTGRTNLMVVTPHWIHLLDGTGKEFVKTPYQPSYPDFGIVQMSVLRPLGQFAVWFEATMPYEKQMKLNPKTHVVWLAENGTITNAMDLPNFPPQSRQDETLFAHLTSLIQPWWTAVPNRTPARIVDFCLSLAGTAFSLGTGWWLGRRYRMGTGALIGWGIFHLLFNAIGLLTFVFVQEWSVRVKCPSCKKPRVVDHEHCEHCGSEFAPAEKNGTEIFEPLGVK